MNNYPQETSDDLYPCPACGAFTEKDARICSNCGSVLTDPNKRGKQERPKHPDESLFVCKNCGTFIGIEAKECPACGTKRAPYTATVDIIEGELKGETPAVKDYLETDSDLFLCSGCGAFISPDAANCEICGAVVQSGDEFAEGEEDYEDEEIIEEAQEISSPLVTKGAILLCGNCGAFISGTSSE